MPYLITTTTPDEGTPNAEFYESYAHAVTRRAVATLDEALFQVDAMLDHWDDTEHGSERDIWIRSLRTMVPEQVGMSGGTVGPLPDGTVIEVAQIGWINFERLTRHLTGQPASELPPITVFDDDDYRTTIIDAYNAAQEAGR